MVRVPILDGSDHIQEQHLPDRLDSAALSSTYAAAIPSTITRDVTGRVVSVTANGVVETYDRDPLGRVATITRGAVTYTVTRDALGRVEAVA